jgi:hypothetical protein
MAFWSGEKIAERLDELIDSGDASRIDCASYTLSVGPEYYVSPTDRTPDAKSRSLVLLAEDQAFAIPPGQFAYISSTVGHARRFLPYLHQRNARGIKGTRKIISTNRNILLSASRIARVCCLLSSFI